MLELEVHKCSRRKDGYKVCGRSRATWTPKHKLKPMLVVVTSNFGGVAILQKLRSNVMKLNIPLGSEFTGAEGGPRGKEDRCRC
jgi:hypothetical protein